MTKINRTTLLALVFFYLSSTLILKGQEKTIEDLGYTKDEALTLSNKAADFFDNGKFKDAEQTYLKVIKIEPNAHAYYNLGVAYEYLKEFDKAEKAYLKALEIEPLFYTMYSYLAELMILMQKNKESVSYAKTGFSKTNIKSEKFECLFTMARAYRNLDSCSQSKDCFSRSLLYIYPSDQVIKRIEKHKVKFIEKCKTQIDNDTNTITKREIYTVVDKMPSFPGGQDIMTKFITSPLTYNLADIKVFHEGKVILQFVVNEDGWISNIKVLKEDKSCPECSSEAIRIVTWMPQWEPAINKGKIVPCYYFLPINFKK